MKKKILLSVILILTLIFTLASCKIKGQKEVVRLEVIEGLKTEYELNEVPDYSNILVRVTYNDETTKEVRADELQISVPDTSISGNKKITITYEGKSFDFNITVKGQSIDDIVVLSGIEYQSGLEASMYATSKAVDTTLLSVIANYSDGTKAVIDNTKLSTNISELDFSVPGSKTVVIKFQDKTCEFVINVLEVKVERIEVDADSIDTVVEAGGTLDISGIKVYAIYNNGARILISNTDEKLDLTSGMPDLTNEGDKDYIIKYGDLSCKLVISTNPPVLENLTIDTTGVLKTILLGDSYSVAGIIGTAYLSNNTSRPVANSDLVIDASGVNTAGTATVTVSYTLDGITKTASYEVKVLTIAKVEIDTSSISLKVESGTTYDYSNIKVIVTDSEGGTRNCALTDGVTVNTSGLNTNSVGKDGYINATYRGVTSANVNIVVYDKDTDYYITGVTMPESLDLFENNKKKFTDSSFGYVVGDDNPFYFTLTLSLYNSSGVKMDDTTVYTSYSEVYLNGAKLTDAGLAKYVSIDESKNSFDFTEEAIGKTFTIKTRPRDGVAGYEDKFTKSLDVTVVDGLNIYEAWELNYITNYDSFDEAHINAVGMNQITAVDQYLNDEHNGAKRPETLNGIVLHNELIINSKDLPKQYFLDSVNRTGTLYDSFSVFSYIHPVSEAGHTLTIHGNYFTIHSYLIPEVCAEKTGNQTDAVSNAEVFGFRGPKNSFDYQSYKTEYAKYNTVINNLHMNDDHPQSNEIENSVRDMRGLIGIKTFYNNVNINNARLDRYYISYILDSDYQHVVIKDSIFYNSWQNHLFVWSDNPYVVNDEPSDDIDDFDPTNYPTLTLDVINTSITKSGGPVIISQLTNPEKKSSAAGGAIINIDEKSNVWTYVTGTEAWFGAMSMDGPVSLIKTIGSLLTTVGGDFTTSNPPAEAGVSGAGFMNLISIQMSSGLTLDGTDDIDGKLTIKDKTILDMSDGLAGGYANALVSLLKQIDIALPVFVSSEGGVGVVLPGSMIGSNDPYVLNPNVHQLLYTMLVQQYGAIDHATFCYLLNLDPTDANFAANLAALDAANAAALGQGEFVTLYHNALAISFGYNIDKYAAKN